ncbi:LTA synthase family protein, partial [Clostridium sp. CCUG 7971]|nr:LTA synthase family protein [Clostridium sp. CCUG 7971]
MDPTVIKEVKYSEDPIPNFRKISKENKSGYINVPVVGGGTARTEFEILTGNNFDYLEYQVKYHY